VADSEPAAAVTTLHRWLAPAVGAAGAVTLLHDQTFLWVSVPAPIVVAAGPGWWAVVLAHADPPPAAPTDKAVTATTGEDEPDRGLARPGVRRLSAVDQVARVRIPVSQPSCWLGDIGAQLSVSPTQPACDRR
jgi:hypothetical protein